MTTWLWSLVNIGVALAGYYLSAIFIDNKYVLFSLITCNRYYLQSFC